jgi:hypothetical protein
LVVSYAVDRKQLMFPGPVDIPAVIDCPALAKTGIDTLFPLIFGLIVVALGITFFVMARGRARRSGLALGLVLLLGGAGLAVAPVSSAQADDCTPIDYSLDGIRESPEVIPTGGTVEIAMDIINVVDRNGTPPIVVTIPKSSTFTTPLLDAQSIIENWTFTETTTEYVLTYSGPLPVGTRSSVALFSFNVNNGNSSTAPYSVPVSIVTGSGGDTVVTNNIFTVEFSVTGIPG